MAKTSDPVDPLSTQEEQKESDVAAIPHDLDHLNEMLEAIKKEDKASRLAATKSVRKLLSTPANPPVQEVVDAGFIPYLCKFLQMTGENMLQFEAAWALTNIGSSDLTYTLMEAGVLPHLVPLLRVEDPQLREQAAWCLGNIAGDRVEYRDMILDSPVILDSLVLNLQHPANISMLQNVTWTVSNLCRGSKSKPALNKVAPFVPVLKNIIERCGDEATIVDACWALSYISDGEDARLEVIVQSGLCETLIHTLRNGTAKSIPPCLRTLGNVVTGTDQHTQTAIDAGLLRELVVLMENEKTSVRKEAVWTASNITAGTKAQIGAFLAMPGLPEALFQQLEDGEWSVQKEAAWTVANICNSGSSELIQCIVERHNAIGPLCALLSATDAKIITLMLSALESILKVSTEYSVQIEEAGGLDTIEDLQNHSDDKIYQQARTLIETYFGCEDEEDENIAPEADTESFAFSKPFAENTMLPLPHVDPAAPLTEQPFSNNFNFSGMNFA